MKKFDYPEGATPLDPDEIDGLKLKHISTREELDRWEHENIQDAIVWLERRRKTDILNEEFICQLHEKMFGKVWKWASYFRRTNKNLGVQWTAILVELRQLLEDVRYWIENGIYAKEEITYRLHHKMVWIHLFPNGNGRHSRMMADILLTDVLEAKPFTSGNVGLTNPGESRKRYIKALKAADLADFSLLKEFVIS